MEHSAATLTLASGEEVEVTFNAANPRVYWLESVSATFGGALTAERLELERYVKITFGAEHEPTEIENWGLLGSVMVTSARTVEPLPREASPLTELREEEPEVAELAEQLAQAVAEHLLG
ncbi:hypothetical protein [Actinomadura nitritigenes]|uniref:hypothetical protein n=1 Tax=Actinomadura nitritigenes TaxID=134602 RepID=UPI003D90954B